ncbi:MAG: 50S ribosomal protein L30 [Sphaerochaetaceae bacterium]|jgi:large subunit ribosomal protein L30|nr:50S ribosomal protein L30 [Sphaerochaetaceae bacterium]HHU89242.1 50S ribosomal protein L30 [Spirochaetales bacterium]
MAAKKKSENKKVKVTLVRSVIGSLPKQRKTVKALGLGKINSSIEHEATPQILGMVRVVNHLVKVEEL